MSRNLTILVALSALLPLGVYVPGSDSTRTTTTRFRAATGGGHYVFVARGCEGEVIDEVPARFTDGSVSFEQRFGGAPLVLGARGGWIRDRIDAVDSSSMGRFPRVPLGQTVDNRYVNPYIGFDTGREALAVGYVFHERDFITAGEGAREKTDHSINNYSFHVRAGRLDREYFQAQWMESEPLYSGGGYLTMGFGAQTSHRPLSFFAGISAGGPYEGAGYVLRGSYRLGAAARLNPAGRVGAEFDTKSSAASVGFELATPPKPR